VIDPFRVANSFYHQQLPYFFWQPNPQANTPDPQLPSNLQHSSIKNLPLYPLHVVPRFLGPHLPFKLTAGPVGVGTAVVAVVTEVVVMTVVGFAVEEILMGAEDMTTGAEDMTAGAEDTTASVEDVTVGVEDIAIGVEEVTIDEENVAIGVEDVITEEGS
jgi:hypothetical protein